MAIVYDPNGLFTLLGKFIKASNAFDDMEREDGASDGIYNFMLEMRTQFEACVNNVLVGADALADLQGAFVDEAWNWRAIMRSLKRTLVEGYVPAAMARFITTLEDYPGRNLTFLFDLLWDRMILDSETINANTITLGAPSYGREDGTKHADPENAANSNLGSTTLILARTSAIDHFEDFILEYIFSQALRIHCLNGYNEGSTDGNASFQIEGPEVQPDGVYVGGTGNLWENLGILGTVTEISENTSSVLSNGEMENFTVVDTPDDWDIDSGAAGVDIKETATSYRGSKALDLVSAAVTQVSQNVFALVEPKTTYVLCCRMRKVGTPTFSMEVKPWSASYVFDAAEKIIETQAALTASYQLFHCIFNTPEILPADLRIELEFTPTAAAEIYVDDVFLAPLERFRGLGVALIAGDRPAYESDLIAASVTNDYAGVFQTFFGRYFARSLPSDAVGGETLGDALAI